jgi:hypothetical protein
MVDGHCNAVFQTSRLALAQSSELFLVNESTASEVRRNESEFRIRPTVLVATIAGLAQLTQHFTWREAICLVILIAFAASCLAPSGKGMKRD